MVIEEQKCVEVVIKTNDPILKPIELKNIGFLQQQPTYIDCPACAAQALSLVRLEVVTYLQRFLECVNWCQNWSGRRDINHYCGKCGCYIGRYIPVSCSERCISHNARRKAAHGAMTLKTKPKDCADVVQRVRENVKTKQKAAKEAKQAKEAKEAKARVEDADGNGK